MALIHWTEDIVARRIGAMGGIASTGQLRAAGIERMLLDVSLQYGMIARVRKGWFATWDVPEVVRLAWRVGGRVACVTALELHGELLPTATELHVEVSRGASRLRALPDREVIVHWCRHPVGEGRLVAPLALAREQARHCKGEPPRE